MSNEVMGITRRKFAIGAGTLAFTGLLKSLSNAAPASAMSKIEAYGPLVEDPDGILDLPMGFNYKIISRLGDQMDDGFLVPDRADGMGCIALDGTKVALVRNHEIGLRSYDPKLKSMHGSLKDVSFDYFDSGEPLPGGTTTIIFDMASGERTSEYRSLIGTLTNCAGGVTPWGTWLSCEETVRKSGKDVGINHGWVFEVPANERRLTRPVPLTGLGRFKHEAAAVDPNTGIVYLTEDRPNSLFYRFIPKEYGNLLKGGRLQALGLLGEEKGRDSRNWEGASFIQNNWADVRWIDLDEVDSPKDDLRIRGRENGAVIFARGEGIHWADGELYFCCTSGGREKLGRIMRYQPSDNEGSENENPGRLQLFFESTDPDNFNFGDNLTVAPNGHLLVCEDQYSLIVDNHLRGITPDGVAYPFAKLRMQTELAGACFSPDGSTLFVNIYKPTMTLAITGAWGDFS